MRARVLPRVLSPGRGMGAAGLWGPEDGSIALLPRRPSGLRLHRALDFCVPPLLAVCTS